MSEEKALMAKMNKMAADKAAASALAIKGSRK
jgi:hypothetical protein